MQTTPKPIPTKSPRKTKTAARFLLDWAAVIALALCFIVFTLIKGSRFMSVNNMINILRAMSITTVFVGRSVGGAERPNALGTLIGAMMVSTLENGLTICAVPFYVLPAVKGAVLALALVAAYATKKEQ